jgi:hypothetical protein
VAWLNLTTFFTQLTFTLKNVGIHVQ